MERRELRAWVEDALQRHDRDVRERGEEAAAGADVSVPEIVDAVWGRLPLPVRRATSRAEVQASLTMLTLRHGIAAHAGDHAGSPPTPQVAPPRPPTA